MTFPELDKRLDKTVKDIQNFHNGTIMGAIGAYSLKMIKDRVIEKGENADGKKFNSPGYSTYSTKPMFFSCNAFINKTSCEALLSTKEKRKALQWRTIKGHKLPILQGGYKKFREMQNRKTEFVNFSLSGKMWGNINVISKSSDHQKGIAIIGARTEEHKVKLSGNTERFGDILDLSQSEQEDLMKRYNLQVLKIFKDNGL